MLNLEEQSVEFSSSLSFHPCGHAESGRSALFSTVVCSLSPSEPAAFFSKLFGGEHETLLCDTESGLPLNGAVTPAY
jgi:hypothetical protein